MRGGLQWLLFFINKIVIKKPCRNNVIPWYGKYKCILEHKCVQSGWKLYFIWKTRINNDTMYKL